MNGEAWIRVMRFPYEEPYHAHVNIAASNGKFSGETEFYCGVDELLEIGQALAQFPKAIPSEYEFGYGSPDPANNHQFLRLRALTVDLAGHCALHFEIDLKGQEPYEGRAAFSLMVEPWALNELGRLFQALHADPSGKFRWTPTRSAGVPS